MSPYADIRMKNEQLLVGQKERQRFSITSVRRFFGDYLDLKSQTHLLNAMGPGGMCTSSLLAVPAHFYSAAQEPCLFSAKCQTIVYPVLRANKLSPRFLILTTQALYIIKLKKEKNMLVHLLERRIPIQTIQSFSFSPYADNFIVIHAPEDFDVALVLDFKTELMATINRAKGSICNISFKPK